MRRMTASKTRIALAALVLAVVGGAVALWHLKEADMEIYRTFASPDGKYRVEVWRTDDGDIGVPGQSGDSPGTIRLVDSSGKTLAEEPVEMVQLAEEVEWTDGHVRVKLLADWDLAKLTAP